ncbi:hypothetical protein ANCDUO_05528 [Ancylostoma duodenale]|uniref:Protein capicua homolog-like C-terminal tri-helical domain-containing protein n=1 Tax=Ancylostoma duodenale TaxID=51022 RepID=A0A0C2GYG3_9BILA|nr:hypothetical protein ANCDUO_05528 [Ancylostoma duodenale]
MHSKVFPSKQSLILKIREVRQKIMNAVKNVDSSEPMKDNCSHNSINTFARTCNQATLSCGVTLMAMQSLHR